MTTFTQYLDLEQVLRIHQAVIDRFGGMAGTRDSGLLEAAIAAPRMGFGGKEFYPDLPSKAAAYHFHLCKNHPFVDGNKRVAHSAAEIFLRINGMQLSGSVNELEAFTLGVAGGTIPKESAIAFFLQHASPRNSGTE